MRINRSNPRLTGVLAKLGEAQKGIKYGEDPRKYESGGIISRLQKYEQLPEVRSAIAKERTADRGKRKKKDNKVLLNKILEKEQ